MSTAVAERPGVMPNPAIVTVTNPATPPASTLASEFATINDYATGSQRVSNDFKAKWQSTYKAAFQVVVSGGLNGSYTAKQYADFANAYEQAKLAGLVGVGTGRGGTSNFDSMYATALTKTAGAGAGLPPTGGLPGAGSGAVGTTRPGSGLPAGDPTGTNPDRLPRQPGVGGDPVTAALLGAIDAFDSQLPANNGYSQQFKSLWSSTYKPAFQRMAQEYGSTLGRTSDGYDILTTPITNAATLEQFKVAYMAVRKSFLPAAGARSGGDIINSFDQIFNNTVQRLYFNNTSAVFDSLRTNVDNFKVYSVVVNLFTRQTPQSTASVTEIVNYVQSIFNSIKNSNSKVSTLVTTAASIKDNIDTLLARQVDPKGLPGVTVAPAVVSYVLNGSPDRNDGQGNLVYDGVRYTFDGLARKSFTDLFTNETQFLRELKTSIGKVVQNKKDADVKAIMDACFNSFAGVMSYGATFLKLSVAFTGALKDTAAIKKAAAEALSFSALVPSSTDKWKSVSESLAKRDKITYYRNQLDYVDKALAGLSNMDGDDYKNLSADAKQEFSAQTNLRALTQDYNAAYKDVLKAIAENCPGTTKNIGGSKMGEFLKPWGYHLYNKTDSRGQYILIEAWNTSAEYVPLEFSYVDQDGNTRQFRTSIYTGDFRYQDRNDHTVLSQVDLPGGQYLTNYVEVTYRWKYGLNNASAEIRLVGLDLGGLG